MIRSLSSQFQHRILKTPTLLTILIGFLLIAFQFLTGSLPFSVQLSFCGFMLVVAGIPHGALDHLVERERAIRHNKPFSLPEFIAKYLFTMGIYATAWLLAPVPCLLVFLLISAWHFGETDLNNAPETTYWSLARLSAGGFVLAFILLTHPAETSPILSRIVQGDEQVLAIWQFIVDRAGSVLRGWATLIVILIMLAYGNRPIRLQGWRIGRLLLILGLAFYLPLLPSFMLYFGGWHALSSFHTLQAYLPANTTTPGQAIWKIWQQSLPLTLISIFFLGIYALIWAFVYPALDPLPSLFIFLSLITLPHIGVMHGIYKEQISVYQ